MALNAEEFLILPLKNCSMHCRTCKINTSKNNQQYLRFERMGEWFFNGQEFQKWKKQPGSLLWLYGIPGSGKTVLSSIVINHLLNDSELSHRVILYYHVDFEAREKESLDRMLRNFLAQLSRMHVPTQEKLWKNLKVMEGKQPTLNQLETAFSEATKNFDFLVIVDGLDELEQLNGKRAAVCGWIKRNSGLRSERFRFLVTSRNETDIEQAFVRQNAACRNAFYNRHREVCADKT